MWKAKFSVYYEGIYYKRVKKFGAPLYGYMLGYYQDKKYFYFTLMGFVESDERTSRKFISDLKKDEAVVKLESQGNFFICTLKERKSDEARRNVRFFYDQRLISLKPFYLNLDGREELEFACFDRKPLEEVLKIAQEKYNLKLDYLKEDKVSSFGILNIFPKLTAKQKESIDFAMKKGYYEYPRKTDVKKLAKDSNLSFSTFQEHLRKAENKLIPFVLKK